MIEPIFNFFEKLITAFSWRRLVFIICLVSIAFIAVIVFEHYTGHFRLGRIKQASDSLEQLVDLKPKIVKSDDANLTETYNALNEDLNSYVSAATTPFNLPKGVLKVLAACVPWIILSLIFVAIGDDDLKSIMIGIIVIGAIFVIIAYFIPSSRYAWINYFLVPVLLCTVPMGMLAWYGKSKD